MLLNAECAKPCASRLLHGEITLLYFEDSHGQLWSGLFTDMVGIWPSMPNCDFGAQGSYNSESLYALLDSDIHNDVNDEEAFQTQNLAYEVVGQIRILSSQMQHDRERNHKSLFKCVGAQLTNWRIRRHSTSQKQKDKSRERVVL